MQADADAQRPVAPDIVLLDSSGRLAGGGHCACRCVRIFERCAEQRQKAVAKKLVHDATIAVDDVDQHGECGIESVHHLLRRAKSRAALGSSATAPEDWNAQCCRPSILLM